MLVRPHRRDNVWHLCVLVRGTEGGSHATLTPPNMCALVTFLNVLHLDVLSYLNKEMLHLKIIEFTPHEFTNDSYRQKYLCPECPGIKITTDVIIIDRQPLSCESV